MDAYDIMRQWDKEAKIKPRGKKDFDRDVPGGLRGDYDDWKNRLEHNDVAAIIEGRTMWGLPPLS